MNVRGVFLLCFGLHGTALMAQEKLLIDVPSGQPIFFHEVIWDQDAGQNVYRFRYIAPEISRDGGSVNFEMAEADLKYLCEKSVLPALAGQGRTADRIVISISDKKVEFGKTNAAATQYFDAFIPKDASCEWEGY